MRLPIFSRAVSIVSAAIAIGVGLIVLFGYFPNISFLVPLRLTFLQWAVAIAAAALLVGVVNLLSVHFRKLAGGGENALYSLVLIISLLVTLILGIALKPSHPWARWIFENLQVPVETSLMAILSISLVFAGARLLRRRMDLFSGVFIVTVLLVLLGTGSFPWGHVPLVGDLIQPWLAQVPAVAGARGILLGVALGTVATGLRVLMGADRPYGG